MSRDKLIDVHHFAINPGDNGGEQITLTTAFLSPGNLEIYYNQTLTLHSYQNKASFHLYSTKLTPEILRTLANALEQKHKDVLKKLFYEQKGISEK